MSSALWHVVRRNKAFDERGGQGRGGVWLGSVGVGVGLGWVGLGWAGMNLVGALVGWIERIAGWVEIGRDGLAWHGAK